jgi:hypothetical protein
VLAHGLLLTHTVPGDALGRGSAVQTHHVDEIVPPPFVPSIHSGRYWIGRCRESTDLVAFIGRQLALPDCREKVANWRSRAKFRKRNTVSAAATKAGLISRTSSAAED